MSSYEVYKKIKKEYKKLKERNMRQLGGEDETKQEVKQLIILTTPHETCSEEFKNVHLCDTYAIKLADCLGLTLAEPDKEVISIHGNINRHFIDLNRNVSDFTQFRKKIREKLTNQINKLISHKKENKRIIYVIDCHSFPPNSDSFTSVSIKEPEVTILFHCELLMIIDELYNLFRDAKLKVTKFIGGENAIINEAMDFNSEFDLGKYNIRIIPVLIEVNESISKEHLDQVCECIKQWVRKINEYFKSQ